MTTERNDQLQANVDRLTKQLQTDTTDAPAVLLQRARAYGDLGEASLAREDIARAAALVREPQYKSTESVAAVERAFREISISGAGGAQSDDIPDSEQDIVDLVHKRISADGGRDVRASMAVLEQRIQANRSVLSGEQIRVLLESFHGMCKQQHGTGPDSEVETAAVASCIGAALSKLAVPDEGKVDTGGSSNSVAILTSTVTQIIDAWSQNESDGGFKQQACRHGAKMYTTAIYALSTHKDSGVDDILQRAVDFYVNQVWLVGTVSDEATAEASDVCQGVLRLLTAARAHFMLAFAGDSNGGGEPAKRLLKLLGQSRTDATEARSLAMLVASQLAAAARDPESSARFPNYDVASVSRTTAPSTPPALAQLRTTTASTLDARVQSTIQSERAQGLLALAALYESGAGSELATTLWAKSGWAEDLWDQGEFDKRETQLALLCLADACSTDAKVSAVMKRLGNGLVQALARKRSDQEDLELADVASAVLAKWSGLPTAAAAAPRDANTEEVSAPDTDDADPMQLADTHIERITALAGQDITDTGVCAAAERSTEALGFLCLRPELKERVAQNSALLQTLFAAALKSDATALKFATVMLIRNLTQYRPVLSEEQKKMQRLQQLNRRAAAGEGAGSAQTVGETLQGEQGEKENKLDAPELVAQRAALVCNAGAAKCLVSAVQSRASDSMKDAVAEIAVSLATAPRLRGLLVQQGLVRALLSIATSDAPRAPASKDEQYAPRALVQARDKHVALALAKIAISVPPHLAFRDPRGVVRLVLSLLAEESDAQALLMRFEALLALTNLASVEPGSADDVRGYMACDLGGMSLIEMCVLSDHVMVRRASTELMCNLVYDPRVFERFVGDADKYVAAVEEAGELLPSGIVELASDDEGDAGDKDDGYRAQRMHLLVALADVDDAATRSAAAGALAVLSNDARCCRYLVLAHPRALAVLLDLADDSDEDTSMRTALRHRAAVVCANAAGCGDTRVVAKMCAHEGLVRVLREMTGDSQMPYYTAAKSALELLGL